MPPVLSPTEIHDVNTRYHDLAAEHYDSKWGIDFGELGCAQVLAKLRKALGQEPGRYPRSLEIGAGTGYFTLNMMRAGVIGEATCTDISQGMLSVLQDNAHRSGCSVSTEPAEAESLPFTDGSFELVFGHAVLHHIPDLPRAFTEFARVLAPGGTLLFAGEPSRQGDRLASVPKRLGGSVAPLWRRAIGARPARAGSGDEPDAALERVVDVHAFLPAELEAFARGAQLEDVRVNGEELLANWFGWMNRSLEATAEPSDVPFLWRQYAHKGYLLLQELDRRLFEPRLPAAVFYNLMITARKPS